jgi:hypothetical protein
VTEALAPAAETALWKKLAGEIRRAQIDVEQGTPAGTAAAPARDTEANDQDQIVDALALKFKSALTTVESMGNEAMASTGASPQAKSTGNAAADAVLQLAGFQLS